MARHSVVDKHHKATTTLRRRNALIRTYYDNLPFFAFCCIGTELFYVLLYLLHFISRDSRAYDPLRKVCTHQNVEYGPFCCSYLCMNGPCGSIKSSLRAAFCLVLLVFLGFLFVGLSGWFTADTFRYVLCCRRRVFADLPCPHGRF